MKQKVWFLLSLTVCVGLGACKNPEIPGSVPAQQKAPAIPEGGSTKECTSLKLCDRENEIREFQKTVRQALGRTKNKYGDQESKLIQRALVMNDVYQQVTNSDLTHETTETLGQWYREIFGEEML